MVLVKPSSWSNGADVTCLSAWELCRKELALLKAAESNNHTVNWDKAATNFSKAPV
jgi:hypothetical protein